MTRIFLTGTNGQLGSELARTLGGVCEVIATTRRDFDLADSAAMLKSLDQHRPDFIVNAAAYTAVDMAEAQAKLALKINAHAVEELARWAKVHDAALIHFSSDYVFDGKQHRPYVETDPAQPLSIYGRSKLLADEAIAESGCLSLVFRTSSLFSERSGNFVTKLLERAVRGDALPVVNDQISCPTSARDLAHVVASIFARLLTPAVDWRDELAARGGLFNAVNEGAISRYDFACAVLELANAHTKERLVAVSSDRFQSAAPRPENSTLDCGKLLQLWGLSLPHWRPAVEDCVRKWQQPPRH